MKAVPSCRFLRSHHAAVYVVLLALIGCADDSATLAPDAPRQRQLHSVTIETGNNRSSEVISRPEFIEGRSEVAPHTERCYLTGGAASSEGHALEYQFDWGHGRSSWGDVVRCHQWASGVHEIKARARCVEHKNVVSPWSVGHEIMVKGPECVLTPGRLEFGDVPVGLSKDMTFTIRNGFLGTLTGFVRENCVEYSIVSGGGRFSLDAMDAEREVIIRFSPRSAGAKDCTVDTGSKICPGVICIGNGVNTPGKRVGALTP